MADSQQVRRDARIIEDDVVTVRGFIDYPTASGRDVYLRAVEALDRLASLAHRAERRDDAAAKAIRSAERRLASVPALVEALRMGKRIAERGVGTDTSPEEVLVTLVAFFDAKLKKFAVYEQSQGNG